MWKNKIGVLVENMEERAVKLIHSKKLYIDHRRPCEPRRDQESPFFSKLAEAGKDNTSVCSAPLPPVHLSWTDKDLDI